MEVTNLMEITKVMEIMTYKVSMPLALGHDEASAMRDGEQNAECFQADAWSLVNRNNLWILVLFHATEQEALEAWKMAYETYDWCIGTKDMVWEPTLTIWTQNQPSRVF